MNLWRKIRYRRELEEIEYHRNMCAKYNRLRVELFKDYGLVRNQDAIIRCNRNIENHQHMIDHLKAQIYGGAK